ncbi:actin-like protein, partial [Aspergillus japonicus CBS 114.51]
IYAKLQVAPEDHPVLLAIATGTSPRGQVEIAQIMFQNFNIPALELVPDAILLAYAAGRTTGAVVNSETPAGLVTAVVDGVCVACSTERVNLS